MGSFSVGRSQNRFNQPVEVYFLSVNDLTLVGSATFCSILSLGFNSSLYCTVLFFYRKRQLLLPTNHKKGGLVISQTEANIHSLVPTSLQYLATNLYKSVVDLIYLR